MMNLTPAQLEQLRQLAAGSQIDIGGQAFTSNATGRAGMDDEGQAASYFYGFDPAKQGYGDPYSVYDASGNYLNQGQFKDPGNGLDLLAMGALAALSMGALFPAGAGGAAASGGAGGLGTLGEFSMGGLTPITEFAPLYPELGSAAGGLGSLGAVGESVSGVYPGLEAGLETMPAFEVGISPITGTVPAFQMSPALLAAGAGAGAGGDLAKIAAPILGAVAGSQGVKNETTTEKKMDPRMDPFIYGSAGSPGLLQQTQALMNAQMQPGALAGYDQMKTLGSSLLNKPVASNGFSLLYPNRS